MLDTGYWREFHWAGKGAEGFIIRRLRESSLRYAPASRLTPVKYDSSFHPDGITTKT